MTTQLKEARLSRGQNQQQAAEHFGVTQAYFSMLEKGLRKPSRKLAQRFMRFYKLPPTLLPTTSVATVKESPGFLARELGCLGYPGFAHLGTGQKKLNPAEFLLMALSQNNLEARTAEGLPWLVAKYPDMNCDWLVQNARSKNLQNRLGFAVTLAHKVSNNATLQTLENALEDSKLAKLDSFCRELSEGERRWLLEHRSAEAEKWNLLSDLRPETLRYVR
jgi:transcriptional regulator with XRE-family HTH domain